MAQNGSNHSAVKKMAILIVLLIVLGILTWYYSYQESRNYCKEKCLYRAFEQDFEGSRLSGQGMIKADYWEFINENNVRQFPTQEQCLDYCLISR